MVGETGMAEGFLGRSMVLVYNSDMYERMCG